jgi:ribosome recycling factor
MAGEEEIEIVIETAKEAMDKTVESHRLALLKVRTGRASTALLDGLMIDYFDTPTPLKQLAALSIPDPRMIVISPFDKSAMGNIEKAIQTSNLGLTPSNDGKVIRISIPPLTEERRKDLVKQVRKMAEEHRVGVREGRRDALAMLKDLEKDGTLGKDDHHRGDKMVQDITDGYIKKIDEMTTKKEEEVLEV